MKSREGFNLNLGLLLLGLLLINLDPGLLLDLLMDLLLDLELDLELGCVVAVCLTVGCCDFFCFEEEREEEVEVEVEEGFFLAFEVDGEGEGGLKKLEAEIFITLYSTALRGREPR